MTYKYISKCITMYLLLFLLFLFVVSVNATPCYELVAPGYDCNKYGGAVWTGQSGLGTYTSNAEDCFFMHQSRRKWASQGIELILHCKFVLKAGLITAIVPKRMQSDQRGGGVQVITMPIIRQRNSMQIGYDLEMKHRRVEKLVMVPTALMVVEYQMVITVHARHMFS